jgi:molybdenum cofactor cytidylyltransferase
MNIGAVILAAGYSSRIGGFKPLMQLDGQSLIERCAGLFRQAGIKTILVVTGHRAQEVEIEANRIAVQSIHNPYYDRGMFSSICTAVRHLSGIAGFFVLPVDIPLIRPATVITLLASFDDRSVIYPCFGGLRGHPPLIPAHLIPAILTHDGQGGLKGLLATQVGQDIDVWDQGVLLDADTSEDFAVLTQRLSRLDIGEPAEALALAAQSMPVRGLRHGLAVAGIASALGRELNRRGCNLDLFLLHNAALLHDIAKGQSQHEKQGAQALRGLGLGRLSRIVATHRDTPPPASGKITEKEIVCLADKLVRGSRRIPVRKRFEEKLTLYKEDQKACQAIRNRLANALALQSLVEKAIGQKIEDFLRSEEIV